MGPRGAIHPSACPVLRHSESDPHSLSVRKCGAAGSASGPTACPVCPTLRQSGSRHCHVSPLCPGARLRPSYRSGCMFLFIYLVSDFLPFDFLSVLVVRGGAVCLCTPPSWFSPVIASVVEESGGLASRWIQNFVVRSRPWAQPGLMAVNSGHGLELGPPSMICFSWATFLTWLFSGQGAP